MKMRKKTVVYPFTREFLPWFDYFQEFNPDYQITALVSPRGFSMNGRDAGFIDNRRDYGIIVREEISGGLAQAEALLVPDSPSAQMLRSKVLGVIRTALQKGLDVLCALPLSQEELSEFSAGNFTYYADPADQGIVYKNTAKLEELSAPVVFVGELLEDTNAADTLFSLAAQFRRSGYQTAVIAERKDSRLAGVSSYPGFFYEPMLGEDKALRLNRFLYELDEREQPDVILMQLPGGMVKFNNRHTNGMGIGAYLVSQAVSCDCFVLSASCGLTSDDMFRDLDHKFRLCFGFGIDAVGVSNRTYDTMAQLEVFKKMEYYCLAPERVREIIDTYCPENKYSAYQLFCREEEEKLYQTVISALTEQTVSY